MKARSFFRGHSVITDPDGRRVYADTLEPLPGWGGEIRRCAKSGSRHEMHESDACLGDLPGVDNACCGHGVTEGYIRFTNGTVIKGRFTVEKGGACMSKERKFHEELKRHRMAKNVGVFEFCQKHGLRPDVYGAMERGMIIPTWHDLAKLAVECLQLPPEDRDQLEELRQGAVHVVPGFPVNTPATVHGRTLEAPNIIDLLNEADKEIVNTYKEQGIWEPDEEPALPPLPDPDEPPSFAFPCTLGYAVPNGHAPHSEPKRRIVCLCGSTRFKREFEEANKQETLKGNIVLTVGCFPHTDDGGHAETVLGEDVKAALDQLHLEKIDMSHEVLVINVGGYIGTSTRNEIEHAISKGKVIRFWEPARRTHGEDNAESTGD